jgi:hypothetical protein
VERSKESKTILTKTTRLLPNQTAPPIRDEAATFCGFNMHASVRIAAHDDIGRERLSRCGIATSILALTNSFAASLGVSVIG